MSLKLIIINVLFIFYYRVECLRLVWCNQKQLAVDIETASILCEPRTDYAVVNTTCTLFCPENYDAETKIYKCLPFGWFPNDAPKCTQNNSITLKIVPALLGSIVLLFIISLVIAWYKKKKQKKRIGENDYDAEVGNWKAAKRRQYLKTNPALAKDLDNLREKSDNNELSRANSEVEYDNVAMENERNSTEGNHKYEGQKLGTEPKLPVHKKRFIGLFKQQKKQKNSKNGVNKERTRNKKNVFKRKMIIFKSKFKAKKRCSVSSSSYSFTSSDYTTSCSSDEYTENDSKEEEKDEELILKQENYSQINKNFSKKLDRESINSDTRSNTDSKQNVKKSMQLEELDAEFEHHTMKNTTLPVSTSLTSVKKQENELIEKILFESLISQDKLDEPSKTHKTIPTNYKEEKLKKNKPRRKHAQNKHQLKVRNKTLDKGACYKNSSYDRHILDFEKDYRRKEHRFDGNNYAPSISPVKYYPINPPINISEKKKKKRTKKQMSSNSTSRTGVKYIEIKPSHANLKQEKIKGPSRYSPRKIVDTNELLKQKVVRVTRMKRKNEHTKSNNSIPKNYIKSKSNNNYDKKVKQNLNSKDNHKIPEEYQFENQLFQKVNKKKDQRKVKKVQKSSRRKTNRQKKRHRDKKHT